MLRIKRKKMKLLGMGIMATAFYALVACSPVKFSVKPSDGGGGGSNPTPTPTDPGCPTPPCITGHGSYQMAQDVTFINTNKVDIVVIIDNSGSMATEQQNLSAPFNGFIENLNKSYPNLPSGKLDWQLGVTNTDICPAAGTPGASTFCNRTIEGAQGRFLNEKGKDPRYGNFTINSGTSGAPTLFANIVQRGDSLSETGSGDERAIAAGLMTLDAESSFFREDSNLAFVILSDEDERSVGGKEGEPGYAALEDKDLPQTFVNTIQSRFGGKKQPMVNAIIVKPGDTDCLTQQRNQLPARTANYGTKYQELSDMTNGKVGNICDNGTGAFASMLENITGAIAEQPTSKIITLAYIPTEKPVVTFNPASGAKIWNWAPGTNQIVFDERPPHGTVVHIEYNYKQSTSSAVGPVSSKAVAAESARSYFVIPSGQD